MKGVTTAPVRAKLLQTPMASARTVVGYTCKYHHQQIISTVIERGHC